MRAKTLQQTLGTISRLKWSTSARRDGQMQVTIPKAIADLMMSHTDLWQWDLIEEGVILRPVQPSSITHTLPDWASDGQATP